MAQNTIKTKRDVYLLAMHLGDDGSIGGMTNLPPLRSTSATLYATPQSGHSRRPSSLACEKRQSALLETSLYQDGGQNRVSEFPGIYGVRQYDNLRCHASGCYNEPLVRLRALICVPPGLTLLSRPASPPAPDYAGSHPIETHPYICRVMGRCSLN